MKKFILLLLKFLSPLIIAVVIYIAIDPFKVIWHYDVYYESGKPGPIINKGHATTINFLNRYQKENYDSYIFGNSRSIVYAVNDWQKHLHDTIKAYHFDAAGESLFGLNKKFTFIDSRNLKIKNALILIDEQLLRQSASHYGHLFIVPPQLQNNDNVLTFHFTMLRAFFSYKFLFAYIHFKTTGIPSPYMAQMLYSPTNYDPVTNEMYNERFENQIANGTYYTKEVRSIFYKRDTVQYYYSPRIKDIQKKLLTQIAAILKKQGTHYKIVINPLYDQKKLNRKDIEYLEELFGKNNVYDYSGINVYTNNYQNYYEITHYRPNVASAIMNEIYKE